MARFIDYATCPPDDHSDLGWVANPTGAGKRSRGAASTSSSKKKSNEDAADIAEFEDKESERYGAMLANLGVVLSFGAFNALCGLVLLAVGARSPWRQAFATVRFPSFTVWPVLFMLQNVLEPALNLVVYDPSILRKGVSLLVISGTSFVPIACWTITSTDNFLAWCVEDASMVGARRSKQFLWGTIKWVSATADSSFERRYALIFKDFKYKHRRFLMVDIGVVVIISILSAFIARNALHCTIQIALVTLVEVLYLVAVCKYRPFIAELDHWYTVLLTCCQLVAITLALVAMHSTNKDLLTASAVFLLVAVVAMGLKGIFDFYTFTRDRCAERGDKGGGEPGGQGEDPIESPGLLIMELSQPTLDADGSACGIGSGESADISPTSGQHESSLYASSGLAVSSARRRRTLSILPRRSSTVSWRGAPPGTLGAGPARVQTPSVAPLAPLSFRDAAGVSTPASLTLSQSGAQPRGRARARTVSRVGTPPPGAGRGRARRLTTVGAPARSPTETSIEGGAGPPRRLRRKSILLE